MVVILTPIVLMVVGIPGHTHMVPCRDLLRSRPGQKHVKIKGILAGTPPKATRPSNKGLIRPH